MIHVIDNVDGSSCKPTTSAATGPIVVQIVPATEPAIREKKIRTPKVLANIHMTKQKIPHKIVKKAAMLMRPARSLKMPTIGRPMA